ncbi:hypothetical protein J6590_054689 [Homalodisca vitripennis]|nr:hypothetical protein J6590_054689 [Homalodisca vitripennis]
MSGIWNRIRMRGNILLHNSRIRKKVPVRGRRDSVTCGQRSSDSGVAVTSQQLYLLPTYTLGI